MLQSADRCLFYSGSNISTGYSGNQVTRYSSHPQNASSSAHIQFENASFIPHNQYVGSSHQTQRNDSVGLELGPPQQGSIGFQQIGSSIQPSNLNSYDDWSRQRDSRGIDDFFSEEEIRTRSHEMLENEDMQQLLRVFSMGGAVNLPEDGYNFSSYEPSPGPNFNFDDDRSRNFNFDDDRSRSSGKAVVGWLKIKAAMRWGIFIRKKAAERRAQLVELEE